MDIDREAAIIDSWQLEAEKLTAIAVEAFRALKEDTTNVKQGVKQHTLDELIANASSVYSTVQSEQHAKSKAIKERVSSTDLPLLNVDTWQAAGFVVEHEISSDDALEKIASLPLKTYKLKDDKQQDMAVSRTQRRTRYHIGPVEGDDSYEKLDQSTIFSFNVGAVAHLAKSIEELSSQLSTTSAFLHHHSAMDDKMSHLTSLTKGSDSFTTPAQLASEVAALETEAALKRVTQLCHSLVQSTKINLLRARLASRLKSLAANDLSSEKATRLERAAVSSREMQAEDANAGLDTVIVYFDAIEEMKMLWNSTVR